MSTAPPDRMAAALSAGILRRWRREPDLALGLVLIAAILAIAVFPALIAHQSPIAISIDSALEPPRSGGARAIMLV